MNEFEPSGTALTAAAARAAHLIVDSAPLIFADNLAARLLGDRAAELLGYHRGNAGHPILTAARTQVTCRSRVAEDTLAAAADRGVRQYVLLGAGLDSFCWRSALAGEVRVFEVDHPSTQRWKQGALAAAKLDVPGMVSFVPADIGQDSLRDALAAAGFDPAAPAVISCLGVIMYLTPTSLASVLTFVASCAPGTRLVADYMLPAGLRDPAGDMYVELVAPAAAERGEPWQTFLRPEEMSELLGAHGSFTAEHLRQRDQVPAQLWERTDSLAPIELSMVVRATLH